MYQYDIKFTNVYGHELHIYVEALTNGEAIRQALTQLEDFAPLPALTGIQACMLG